MDTLETAYGEFAEIVGSTWSYKVKVVMLHSLYDRLGNASVAFDNMVYERLGMSADDALGMLGMGDVLP